MLQNTRQSTKKRVPKAGAHMSARQKCAYSIVWPRLPSGKISPMQGWHTTHTLSLLSCSPHIDFAFIVAAGHLRSAVTAPQEGLRFRAHFGNPGYRSHMGRVRSKRGQKRSDRFLRLTGRYLKLVSGAIWLNCSTFECDQLFIAVFANETLLLLSAFQEKTNHTAVVCM